MKIAYFDCGYGAAGDMLLGALIAAGLSADEWLKQLKKIDLPPGSFEVEIKDVSRCSLAAKKVNVVYEGQPHTGDHHDVHSHAHTHSGGESQSHEHTHTHTHTHEHTHPHEHSHGHGVQRNLPEILNIIQRSEISTRAKELATRIFTTLGEAEAKVHGVPVESVHFHEVGAIDAIVDILGFAIGYDMLGIECSTVSPLPVGSGHVQTAHGLFPVPAPAVVNILATAGIPTATAPFKHECLTPTGAAILCAVADSAGPAPSMKILSAGYGAGTFNPPGFPNVSRLVIGESVN